MSVSKPLIFIALLATAILTAAVVWYFFRTPPVDFPANTNVQTVQTQNKANSQPTNSKKTERNSNLQSQTDSLLHFFDRMPPVPVYLTDESIVKGGTNVEHGVAYTECGKDKTPTMYMKKVFYDKGNQKQIVNILKHELTHAWQCRRGGMRGHDAEFRRKFEQAGGFGN